VAYVQTCQGIDTGPIHLRILKSYITPNLHKKCYVFVECKITTWWLYQYFLELMPYFFKDLFYYLPLMKLRTAFFFGMCAKCSTHLLISINPVIFGEGYNLCRMKNFLSFLLLPLYIYT